MKFEVLTVAERQVWTQEMKASEMASGRTQSWWRVYTIIGGAEESGGERQREGKKEIRAVWAEKRRRKMRFWLPFSLLHAKLVQ